MLLFGINAVANGDSYSFLLLKIYLSFILLLLKNLLSLLTDEIDDYLIFLI